MLKEAEYLPVTELVVFDLNLDLSTFSAPSELSTIVSVF